MRPDHPDFDGKVGASSGKEAVLILGAHRSGTSLASRLVNLMGYTLGKDLLGPHDCNVAGLWENAAIVSLNEELLAEAGSAWFDHGLLDAGARHANCTAAVDRISETVKGQFGEARRIAIKDPRICRFVPLYEAALQRLGYRVRSLVQYRNPIEAALSVYRRDGLPVSLGLGLWAAHMLQILRDTRGQDRLFVEYGELIADAEAEICRIDGWLAGSGNRNESSLMMRMVACIDPSLRTWSEGDRMPPLASPALHALVGELYDYARRLRHAGRADFDIDEAFGRYRSMSRSPRWLRTSVVAILHYGSGHEDDALAGAMRDVTAEQGGLLMVVDGEEDGERYSGLASMALRGELGLFFNRSVRGESASLVRGISLVGRRHTILVRRSGWQGVGETLRSLMKRGTDKPVIVIDRSMAGEGRDRVAASALLNAGRAIFVPRGLVKPDDPWSCIDSEGDALECLMEGREMEVDFQHG